MVEEIQMHFVNELDKYKQVQRDYQKTLQQRQQLESQLHENIMVKKELDLLKTEDDVFKLVGPILMKQELDEVKENVSKRMEYISSELNRVEELIVTLDKKQDTHREALKKYEHAIQTHMYHNQAKA